MMKPASSIAHACRCQPRLPENAIPNAPGCSSGMNAAHVSGLKAIPVRSHLFAMKPIS